MPYGILFNEVYCKKRSAVRYKTVSISHFYGWKAGMQKLRSVDHKRLISQFMLLFSGIIFLLQLRQMFDW